MNRDLMKSNVYDVSDTIVLVGSCLERMQPNAYKELTKISTDIFEVCLEQNHINMALSKLLGMLARVPVKKLIFATVDKSMHCTQLHYLESEIAKIIDVSKIQIIHYVAVDDELIQIPSETIKLSKNLAKLSKIFK